jgi:hypothetical protein
MTDQQITPPPELDKGGKWGLIVLVIFLLGVPVAGVIYTLIRHKP